MLPSRNLASTRGDGKCRVDGHEIYTCLYNRTVRDYPVVLNIDGACAAVPR